MWFSKWFKKSEQCCSARQPYGEHGLTRESRGYFQGFVSGPHYRYFCSCGKELSEGPSGGLSVNAVCHECKINYGCLPGYYGDQD